MQFFEYFNLINIHHEVLQMQSSRYKISMCGNSICNICSISCSDDTQGYIKEKYCIGKCKECIGPTQPKQSSLASFFKPTVKSGSSKLASVSVKLQKEERKPEKAKTRNLLKVTADNWKETTLVKSNVGEWLTLSDNKTGYVVSLNCHVCKTFSSKIQWMIFQRLGILVVQRI